MSATTSYLDELLGAYLHQGLFAIVLVLSVVAAARRASGWVWVVGSVALCSAVLSVACLAFASDEGSVGTTGGMLVLFLTVLLVAAGAGSLEGCPPPLSPVHS